jgi:hypothetical protein
VTQALAEWVSDGNTNHGLTIKGSSSSGNVGYYVASSDNVDISIRPRLVFTYTLMESSCHRADVHPNADHSNPAACDGDVDIADIQRIAGCWQQPVGAACPAVLDMDGSGDLGLPDIVIAAGYWGWRR